MKIKSAKISNVLSFPYREDIDNSPETIVFDPQVNILIGPNGSGKSNLLEILSKVMDAYFFTQFEFDDNSMALLSPNQKPIRLNTSNIRQGAFNGLVKHRESYEKDSQLRLVLEFDAYDASNLKFIVESFEELKSINLDYSTQSPFFSKSWRLAEFDFGNQFEICFPFKLNNPKGGAVTINLEEGKLSEKEIFVHDYLENFNLIQKLIEIGSTIKGKSWEELKTTFALIGSLRQFGNFVNQISIGVGSGNQLNSAAQNVINDSTKNTMSADLVFQIACMRIGQIIKINRDGRLVNDYLEMLQTTEESLIKRINNALLDIDLKVSLHSYNPHSLTIQVSILNNKNEIIDFNELSTGQKSIFHLVFSIYGYDLENGLLIIDEPELHLHTSMQKKYFQILKRIAQPFNLQIILATHSPVFVDESTIKNTFRFSKPLTESIITRPSNAIGQTQKELLQILTYTNSSRIFFSDIVVLVEGSSDEYFFKYFYENYYVTKRISRLTVEFLGIGGKGNRRTWMDFLSLFKISGAFIGDFDNIRDEGIAQSAGVHFEKLISDVEQDVISRANQQITASGSSSKDGVALLRSLDNLLQKDTEITDDEKQELRDVWGYLMERCGVSGDSLFRYLNRAENTGIFQNIKDEIAKKYAEGIYILQRGDLEAYLGISKDINNVIDFCANKFEEWIKEEEAKGDGDSKLFEIMKVMDLIVGGEEAS